MSLNDSQWLSFISLSKDDFVSALNHAIELHKIPQLKNILFNVWFDIITLDDIKFKQRIAAYQMSGSSFYVNVSAKKIATSNNHSEHNQQSYNVGYVFTKCTGICSTCNRDVCLEEM